MKTYGNYLSDSFEEILKSNSSKKKQKSMDYYISSQGLVLYYKTSNDIGNNNICQVFRNILTPELN